MKWRTIYLLVLALCYLPPLCQGQILNVEDVRMHRDSSDVWVGSLGFDFTLNNRSATPTNPIQFTSLSTRANLARFGEHNALWFVNLLNYSAITGNAFLRTGYSHLRYTLGYKRPLGAEVFGQGQYDRGRGLEARWLTGAGARVRMLEQEKIEVYAGVGAMYEHERWADPESEAEVVVNFLKSTNYLSMNWHITPTIRLHMTHYYQLGHDRPMDLWRHRYSMDGILQVKVSKHLSFRTSANLSYENEPIVPIFKFVYAVTNGIMIAF